jgi:hypothetical protein
VIVPLPFLELPRELQERRLSRPRSHVTLYTAEPGGGGIGVHTGEQLGRDGASLPPSEVGNLSKALPEALIRL